MEDEIAEGIFRTLLRFAGIAVRGLVWLVYDFCFETLAWYIGWPVCRVLTFGNLPKENINDYQSAKSLAHFTVSLVGLLALVGLGIALAPWE